MPAASRTASHVQTPGIAACASEPALLLRMRGVAGSPACIRAVRPISLRAHGYSFSLPDIAGTAMSPTRTGSASSPATSKTASHVQTPGIAACASEPALLLRMRGLAGSMCIVDETPGAFCFWGLVGWGWNSVPACGDDIPTAVPTPAPPCPPGTATSAPGPARGACQSSCESAALASHLAGTASATRLSGATERASVGAHHDAWSRASTLK